MALREVQTIDYDAIVVLLSAMVRFKAAGIKFNGDFPEDGENRKLLEDSGFFKSLYKTFAPSDEYTIETGQRNFISTHGQKIVAPEFAAEILDDVSRAVWGERRRCPGVYTTFVELMQNTFSHAVPMKEGERHWWLSVNYHEGEKKVRFSFVDYGIGIFESLATKRQGKFVGALQTLFERFRFGDNAALLRLILRGDLHRTVTGAYFRGEGLPWLLDALKENWLTNLHIISNNVYASVADDDYRTMKSSLGGTFVYWEVTPQNASVKYDDEN